MVKKKVTIYSLAEELGVSVAAISRAFDPNSRLSKEKRKLILEAAKRYGYQPNRLASRRSLSPIRIGVLIFSYMKIFYKEIVDGISAAYQARKDYKVECEMNILQRGEKTLEDAFEILDYFEKEHFDGIIISGIFEESLRERIDRLEEAGIRVATVQYSFPGSRLSLTSVSDYHMIGQIAAQLCGMLLRNSDKKDIVMFTGNKHSPTHQILSQTFQSFSAENGFRIVNIYDTHDDPKCAEVLVKEAFEQHPDLGGIYASSANSLPICQYLSGKKPERKITFIASDVFPSLFPYIKDGTIDATIYQEPFKMGYNAFDKLYRLIAEGVCESNVVMSTPRIVIASNLDNFR